MTDETQTDTVPEPKPLHCTLPLAHYHLETAICVLAALAVTIDAHGGLAFPPPRNNHGNANLFNFSLQTGSRILGWQGRSCAGDMCLWFNVGCFIGCQNCAKRPAWR